jgi:hypothetical protein
MSGPVDGAPPPTPGGPVERRSGFWAHFHHDDEPAEEPEGLWCPRCGGEFREDVTVCADCGVPLEARPDRRTAADVLEDEAAVASGVGFVEYDLTDWSAEQCTSLEAELDLANVRHVWQGRTLHAAAGDEDFVDQLVDAIDEAVDLGDDVVEYELPDWTPEQRDQLAERLVALDLDCRWNGYLLEIRSADEATVDAAILAIDPTFPVTPAAEGESEPEPPPTLLRAAERFLGLD